MNRPVLKHPSTVRKEAVAEREKREAAEKKARIKATLAEFRKQYPVVLNADAPLPLVIRVTELLFAAYPHISRSLVRKSIQHWCRRIEYHRAVAEEDSQRFALDGSVVEPVEPDHRQRAVKIVTKHDEYWERRKKRKPHVVKRKP